MDWNNDACTHQKEFFEIPPAKKQRLEIADTTVSTEITAPMDDLDDIYDTPQSCGSPQQDEEPSPTRKGEEKSSVAIQPAFNLPGLGMANVITANGEHVERAINVSEQVQMGQGERSDSQGDTLKTKGGTEHAMATMQELHEGLVGSGYRLNVGIKDSISTRVLGISVSTPSQVVAVDKAGPAGEGGAVAKEQLKAIAGQSLGQELGNEENTDVEAALQLDHPQEATMLRPIAEGTDLAERLPKAMDTVEIATITNTPTPAQALLPASDSSGRAILPIVVNKDPKSLFDEQTSLEQGEASPTSADPEFELDSSPDLSSSSDISSVSSSSDSDDYEMLDPEEQARRLMQEDGGSDDEAGKRGVNASGGGPLRTLNEKPDEEVQKPNVMITPDMKIKELGNAENLVENIVLIRGKISGEYQVLETGSVLCLEDHTVLGVVAETLGRVQQPLYSVRFTNAAAISEAGIAKGTRIFYVEQHSTYVFTQRLKAFKGSDASNLHDEEVGDDELEFSDDEAEAEHKRRLKIQRQTKRGAPGGIRDGGSRAYHRNGTNRQSRSEEVSINYDDTVDSSHCRHKKNRNDDELYTPLARPSNLHEMMAQRKPPLEGQPLRDGVDRGICGGRGRGDRGRGRWRGDRGRGHRGGRDDRGKMRGGGDGRDHVGRTESRSQHPREDYGPHGEVMEPQNIYHDTSSVSRAQTTMVPPYPPHNSSIPPHAYQLQYAQQYSQTPPQPPYTPSPSYTSQPYPPLQALQQAHYPYPQDYGHTLQYPSQESYGQQPNPPHTVQNHGIPAGAFVNPAFFGTVHHQPPMQQQNTGQQRWMTQSAQARPQQGNHGNGPARMSPESDAAFRAAQDRLNVLRQLSQGSRPP
ncbi:MAG: hypothetical protein LQ347_001948 [Umbilicaria vellea]|nr:MAG: hypothetical protein LQ347_001948 [Umbilicaria vellea]